MADGSDEATPLDDILLEVSLAVGREDYRKGLALLEAAEALEPASARVWDARGDLLCKRGQFDKGAQAYRRALELDPSRDETEEKLGEAVLGRLHVAEMTARAARGSSVTARELRQRSQIAMFLTIICPGLGHLRFEHLGRAIVFGAIHLAALPGAAVLIQNAKETGSLNHLWWGYAVSAILVLNYAVALFDASRLAAEREDEALY
jgi:tetratricopeptide (TPR) repeat protein